MKKEIVILLAFLLVLAMPIFSQSPIYRFVNADTLNIRAGSSADYKVVGKLIRNTRVQILESSGQWWKIKHENIVGYVNSKFLSENVSIVEAVNSSRYPEPPELPKPWERMTPKERMEYGEKYAEWNMMMQGIITNEAVRAYFGEEALNNPSPGK